MQMFSTASKITTTAMHNFKGTCFSTENSAGSKLSFKQNRFHDLKKVPFISLKCFLNPT